MWPQGWLTLDWCLNPFILLHWLFEGWLIFCSSRAEYPTSVCVAYHCWWSRTGVAFSLFLLASRPVSSASLLQCSEKHGGAAAPLSSQCPSFCSEPLAYWQERASVIVVGLCPMSNLKVSPVETKNTFCYLTVCAWPFTAGACGWSPAWSGIPRAKLARASRLLEYHCLAKVEQEQILFHVQLLWSLSAGLCALGQRSFWTTMWCS